MWHRDSLGTSLADPAGRGQPDDGRARHRPFRARDDGGRGSDARGCSASRPGWRCRRTHEEAAPAFAHHGIDELPRIAGEGKRVRLVMGAAYGARSPVAFPHASAVRRGRAGAGRRAAARSRLRRARRLRGLGRDRHRRRHASRRAGCWSSSRATASRSWPTAQSRLMLLGGEPMDGPRHIWWNFVSSSKERIEQAKEDWRRKRFALVPGDEKRVHSAAGVSVPAGSAGGVGGGAWSSGGSCRALSRADRTAVGLARASLARLSGSAWRGVARRDRAGDRRCSSARAAGGASRRCGRRRCWRGDRSSRMSCAMRLSEPAACSPKASSARPDHGCRRGVRGRHRRRCAKTVLPEAGGHRAKAKELLRRRMNGHGAATASSTAARWPTGASSARCRCSTAPPMRCPPTPGPRSSRPRTPRRRCWRACSTCARGNLGAAEARLPAPDRARQGGQRQQSGWRAIAATPCWATCSRAREDLDEAMAAYVRPSAR